jgi:type IV secretory pathway TraG/TraD family ATPase VirD4
VASTARSCLSLWLDNRVARATTTSPNAEANLNVTQLLETGGTLYLVAPAEEAERCRPLFTALLQSLLAAATQRARRLPGGVLAPRLLLALDEVANFARLPRLGGYTSTGPGQGIQVLLCFHDLAQLEGVYGAEQARTIWNNCRARLLLPSQGDLRTLEHFSRAIGDETRGYDLSSWNSEGRRSQSQQRVGRPLASPDSLRRMQHPVLLFASAPPAKLRARRWDQVRAWRTLVNGPGTSTNRPRRWLWKGAGWLPFHDTQRDQAVAR